METHVRVAAWLRIVWSLLGLGGALFFLLVLGGISAIIGATGDPEARIVAPWIAVVGSFVALFIAILSVPGLVTGWGLLNYRPWARILNIILSALDLLNLGAFPISTAVGGYSIWVMLQPETVEMFEVGRSTGRYPTHF
jgi:hypothetical protein